jgi:hypothetical protein
MGRVSEGEGEREIGGREIGEEQRCCAYPRASRFAFRVYG